ncbi:EpsG family protein [Chitinophaga sancti]|uniref:EpsG family protein n=1 Tax=Chitinophaga sancti TaxID=1004 RepID=UPI002A76271D|nr:EpsG family protein [Chitinophaga sancti]WPQ64529.1 EpsG family protein [Chitinophaga sancti]
MFFGLGASLEYVRKDDHKVQLLKRLMITVGLFIILFFVGFRYKIGSDWAVYLQGYNEVVPLGQLLGGKNLNFSDDFTEPGFKIVSSLCSYLGMNFFMFVFLITVFNTFSLYYFIYRNDFRNKLVFLAIILILTVFLEFDILRQSIAFHIVLFGFIGDRIKPVKFILLVVLAMMFHYTAIIFLLFYVFQRMKLTRKKILFLTIVYVISLFVTIPIITSILLALKPLAGGVLSAVIEKGSNLVANFELTRNISFTSILNLAFLCLLYMRWEKLTLTVTESTLVKMFLFYILLISTLKEVQEVADRFSYYYNIGIAFMFALLSSLITFRARNKVLLIVPMLFILMRLLLHFRQEAIVYGQTPYRNYFFMDESDELEIRMRYEKMMTIKQAENEGKKD